MATCPCQAPVRLVPGVWWMGSAEDREKRLAGVSAAAAESLLVLISHGEPRHTIVKPSPPSGPLDAQMTLKSQASLSWQHGDARALRRDGSLAPSSDQGSINRYEPQTIILVPNLCWAEKAGRTMWRQ